MKKIGEIFANIIQYILPFLVTLGLLKLYFYYDAFDINIFEYMEFSEIITSFLDDSVIGLCFTLVLSILLVNVILEPGKSMKEIKEAARKKKPNNHLQKWITMIIFFIPIAVITYFLIRQVRETGLFFMFSILSSMTIVSFATTNINKDEYYSVKMFNLVAGLVFVVLSSFTVFDAKMEVIRVKEMDKYSQVKLTIDSIPFTSDSIRFYIGKTNEYVFVYNKKDEYTTIYPKERIKEILMKVNYTKIKTLGGNKE